MRRYITLTVVGALLLAMLPIYLVLCAYKGAPMARKHVRFSALPDL